MLKLILTLVFTLTLLPQTVSAQKAGVGAWENPDMTIIRWIEETPALGWYYNWRTDQMYSHQRHRRSVEFVPMIHGAGDVNKRISSQLPVRNLLGFNEPDGKHKISVEQAVQLWPKLERRNLRLGSPATTRGGTLGRNSWQRRFMDQVEARGLRVDFMAVHYYSTNGSVSEFRNWLRAVYAEYKRPIWVTEFAYIDWHRPGRVTYEKNALFMEQAIRMLEQLPFVERHAWFAANPYPWRGQTPQINLVRHDLSRTPTGRAFDRVLGDMQASRVSSLTQ